MKIVERRKITYAICAGLYLLAIIIMIINGLAGRGFFVLDVEFSGGLAINVDIGKDFNNDDLSKIITDVTGQTSPQIQKIQNTTQAAIKIKSLDTEKRKELVKAISDKYSVDESSFEIADISATVSGEMKKNAVVAVVVSCVLMLVYISLRFRNTKTGLATIITLLYDALFAVLCYSVFRIPLNNSFIAVILTIIGYAVNDNIVIFDRLRENKKLHPRLELGELINKSINQSLRRCIFTAGTTMLTIVILCIIGVPSMKEFSFPLFLGLLCGLFTSIFLSNALFYSMSQKKAAKSVKLKKAEAKRR
ncbi:protein-export membrane protein SecF [Clostridia bacterium]|nr:protein-export membrane protein SecF [Clostridia bacterium]